ncbi:fluoride efflux transporter FluC [Symbioplanes lichenis]|uniref:fluoride efflux transporter FluC n=1 Tax=Symbioplanes lichenis TaxID=1629072 RepID=UPI002738E342|nr:CrcB family protein [Actinoplanes lichenis]
MRPILTVAAGGLLGAVARYGIGVAWHHSLWSTLVINITGCFLIGVLYTLVSRPAVRLFLGTGFLGGYTTFSTATVDVLLARPPVALAYLAATLVGSLAAAWAGASLVRR